MNAVTSPKLQKATVLIEEFNATVSPENKIDVSSFLNKLEKMGAVNDAAYSVSTWEDIENCGVGRILAKQIANVFRSKEVEEDSTFVSDKKAQKMSYTQLIQHYNPDAPVDAVAKRLKELSGGKRFIVFTENGQVNIEVTTQELGYLIKHYDERQFTTIAGRPVALHCVGVRFSNLVDENPIYAGRPLRDGSCDQLNRSWDGVSQTVRQLIYLAIKTGEFDWSPPQNAHTIMDLAIDKDAETKIRQRAPKASLQWDELNREGKLPSLKVNMSRQETRNNNPFRVGQNGVS